MDDFKQQDQLCIFFFNQRYHLIGFANRSVR